MTTGTPASRAARVKEHARAVGFDRVGVAPTALPEAWSRYRDAVEQGYGADMDWLTGDPELRRDARHVHETARSVVVLGVRYASDGPGYLAQPPAPDEGWIARYAQGKDYHVHVRKMLVRLVRRLGDDPALGYPSTAHRIFTDTGPVLEKAYAQAAGLGWIGKHTLLIDRELGSWLFLAVVLTPLELAPDAPVSDHCGTCRRCLDVCPTDAFPRPYVLDARRCIATWTIESAEPAAVIEPEALGQHVFGCDLCQEVCPWNRKVQAAPPGPLSPRPENVRPRLRELATLDDEAFKRRFPRSAVRRTDARRLRAVVAIIEQREAASAGAEREEGTS